MMVMVHKGGQVTKPITCEIPCKLFVGFLIKGF